MEDLKQKTQMLNYNFQMIKNIIATLAVLLLFSCNSVEKKKQIEETQAQFSERQLPTLEPHRYNVAFLIMDGTYNTELTAPYDIFQHTIFRDSIKAMNVLKGENALKKYGDRAKDGAIEITTIKD